MDMSDRWTFQTVGHVRQMDMSDRWTCQTDEYVRQMDMSDRWADRQIESQTDGQTDR